MKKSKREVVKPEVVETDVEADEVTLESWKKECAQMEAEMEKDSAELRAILDEAKNDPDLDPEMKRIMLETGEKMLGADGWLRDINKFTTDVIRHCDEVIAKCDAIDKKSKVKKGSSCMTVGGFPLHKFAWPLFYGLLSRSSGPRNFD